MNRARPDESGRAVVLGRIGAPFGVQGWVKVNSYTDPPEGIAGYSIWELAGAAGSERRTVLDWKRAGRAVAVRLEGVETREAAQALTGRDVIVDRSELPPTAPGEFYWHDLMGLEACNVEGAILGRVTGVLELPAHPVLVLKGDRERLVPLVPERLKSVDVEGGRLTLDWHLDD